MPRKYNELVDRIVRGKGLVRERLDQMREHVPEMRASDPPFEEYLQEALRVAMEDQAFNSELMRALGEFRRLRSGGG